MRYVVAAIGAIFIFAAVLLLCVFLLPDALQGRFTIALGPLSFRFTPSLAIGVLLGAAAAANSARSSLSRNRNTN